MDYKGQPGMPRGGSQTTPSDQDTAHADGTTDVGAAPVEPNFTFVHWTMTCCNKVYVASLLPEHKFAPSYALSKCVEGKCKPRADMNQAEGSQNAGNDTTPENPGENVTASGLSSGLAPSGDNTGSTTSTTAGAPEVEKVPKENSIDFTNKAQLKAIATAVSGYVAGVLAVVDWMEHDNKESLALVIGGMVVSAQGTTRHDIRALIAANAAPGSAATSAAIDSVVDKVVRAANTVPGRMSGAFRNQLPPKPPGPLPGSGSMGPPRGPVFHEHGAALGRGGASSEGASVGAATVPSSTSLHNITAPLADLQGWLNQPVAGGAAQRRADVDAMLASMFVTPAILADAIAHGGQALGRVQRALQDLGHAAAPPGPLAMIQPPRADLTTAAVTGLDVRALLIASRAPGTTRPQLARTLLDVALGLDAMRARHAALDREVFDIRWARAKQGDKGEIGSLLYEGKVTYEQVTKECPL